MNLLEMKSGNVVDPFGLAETYGERYYVIHRADLHRRRRVGQPDRAARARCQCGHAQRLRQPVHDQL